MRRSFPLLAAGVLLLSGCSLLPFDIVPKDRATPSQESTPSEEIEATASTEVAVEPSAESPTNAAGGPNYDVTPQEALSTVVSICDLPDGVLGDDGMTLIINTGGDEPSPGDLTVDQAGCALGALQIPDSIQAQIADTSALDGRQTAKDGYITYSWTYSPVSGISIIVTVEDS